MIKTAEQEWIASPAVGVWRKPLEREAKESGHTTSIVKYEPNSAFATHPHPYGEEILVLEGCFPMNMATTLPELIYATLRAANTRLLVVKAV